MKIFGGEKARGQFLERRLIVCCLLQTYRSEIGIRPQRHFVLKNPYYQYDLWDAIAINSACKVK